MGCEVKRKIERNERQGRERRRKREKQEEEKIWQKTGVARKKEG